MPEQFFDIRIQRLHSEAGLVTGELYVNGELIGPTYENDALKVEPGPYTGQLRYHSQHNFVQGPSGHMATTGDFLIELVGAKHRSNILFHGGNKPKHSKGCILLGAVTKDKRSRTGFVSGDHTLRKLRMKFYGTDTPDQCPLTRISIQIVESPFSKTEFPMCYEPVVKLP